jgi:hypothetical protein
VSRAQPLTSPEEIERQSESLADFDVAFKLAIECFGGVFDRL